MVLSIFVAALIRAYAPVPLPSWTEVARAEDPSAKEDQRLAASLRACAPDTAASVDRIRCWSADAAETVECISGVATDRLIGATSAKGDTGDVLRMVQAYVRLCECAELQDRCSGASHVRHAFAAKLVMSSQPSLLGTGVRLYSEAGGMREAGECGAMRAALERVLRGEYARTVDLLRVRLSDTAIDAVAVAAGVRRYLANPSARNETRSNLPGRGLRRLLTSYESFQHQRGFALGREAARGIFPPAYYQFLADGIEDACKTRQ